MNINGEVSILSCSSYLPEKRIFLKEVESKYYTQDEVCELNYDSIAVEDSLFPFDMACRAIDMSGDLIEKCKNYFLSVCYTSIHRHGHNVFWSPASSIQRKYSLGNAIPFNLSQGCNGQLLGIHFSLLQLLNSTQKNAKTLVASADSFSTSAFSRWISDYGIIYGDGASVIVLGKEKGVARILKHHTVTESALEEMHRNMFHRNEKDLLPSDYYNVRKTKKEFLEKYGKKFLTEKTKNALTNLKKMIFSDIKEDDVEYFVLPNLGKKLLQENYYSIFSFASEKSTYDFGRKIGHGSGDCGLGLDFLLKQVAVKPGDKILLLGAGAGFSWSAMLIEKE